jgi:hypothetical protein
VFATGWPKAQGHENITDEHKNDKNTNAIHLAIRIHHGPGNSKKIANESSSCAQNSSDQKIGSETFSLLPSQ